MSLLCVGDIAVDTIATVSDFPKTNSNTEVKAFSQNFGGSAANTAVMAAMLGTKTGLVSVFGKDFPDAYYQYLIEHNIDVSMVKKTEMNTTTVFIFSRKNDQISFFYPGATNLLNTIKLPKEYLEKYDIVHLTRNFPEIAVDICRKCKNLKTKVSFNPGYGINEMDHKILKEIIKGCDILFVNEFEHDYLIKLFGFNTIQEIREWADIELIVITLGHHGSKIVQDEDVIVPALDIAIVDPTGAGDSYSAGFLSSYLKNNDPVEAAKMGSSTASYVIQSHLTQPKITLQQVVETRSRYYI